MRRFLIAAALMSSVALAAPAAAQYRSYNQGPTRSQAIERQIDQLSDRIRRAEQRNLISDREEDRLMRRVANISHRYDRFRRNGLNRGEQQDIHQRIQQLRQTLQFERREGRFEDRRDRVADRRDRFGDRRDRNGTRRHRD